MYTTRDGSIWEYDEAKDEIRICTKFYGIMNRIPRVSKRRCYAVKKSHSFRSDLDGVIHMTPFDDYPTQDFKAGTYGDAQAIVEKIKMLF